MLAPMTLAPDAADHHTIHLYHTLSNNSLLQAWCMLNLLRLQFIMQFHGYCLDHINWHFAMVCIQFARV